MARHAFAVRLTHALTALCLAALAFSGWAILVAHPHLYWGEIGNAEMPDFWHVPLPANTHHTGWGRGLHFLSAWTLLLTGLAYLVWGSLRRHFSFSQYSGAQKRTYWAVIFVVTPLIYLTGLAMSPGLTTVFPSLATVWGGHQSARTVHFILAIGAIAFVFGHISRVVMTGWKRNVRGILWGDPA